MIRYTQILLWRLLAALAVLLGILGAVLPVLPSVVFFLVAAWAAGKGWPALEAKLLSHPVCGPYIRRWRERGAVPRTAKWSASAMMLTSIIILQFSAVPLWMKWLLPLLLCGIAVWLWRRPEE